MTEILKKINSPDDLKKIPVEQLQTVADEIREFILSSVSKTGGHLASNLGAIELTLALHYAFDFKKDDLLWDVGHQCYAHKILTQRRDTFPKLRQPDGPSGFPNPAESIYDRFTVGHAGSAVATAIGLALKKPAEQKVVAFVGDASIVNGLSFEALNNLGLVKRQLLIVLNDNSMAIDATQGAVAKYFSKIRLSHTYEDMRRTANNILEHMPVIGKGVEEALEKIKKSIRMALTTNQMFESLNIPYFGPVDGHDIPSLIKLLSELAKLNRPAILHVYTKKGKGFSPAEEDRSKFHSTGPFEINGNSIDTDTGEPKKTFTSVFSEHITKLAQNDKNIVAITSAMCEGTGLKKFKENFPDRFYDVGIAESAAVDFAAGLAKAGKKPVVCIYSTFLQRSFDQIFQEVALQNLPVIFCVDRAGFVGSDGPTHHGMMDIGFIRMMPNIVLVAPANDHELKAALDFAVNSNISVVIRYPKETIPKELAENDSLKKPFELGKSVTVIEQDRPDVTLIAYGSVLNQALQAANILNDQDIKTALINARFAAPLDQDAIIKAVKDSNTVITIEDHQLTCGFGSAVLETAANLITDGIKTPIFNLAAPKKFIPHNTRKSQLTSVGISPYAIAQAAAGLCKKQLRIK